MIRIQNVLVATDFSETSDAALDYGREMARTFGSTSCTSPTASTCCMAAKPRRWCLAWDQVESGSQATRGSARA